MARKRASPAPDLAAVAALAARIDGSLKLISVKRTVPACGGNSHRAHATNITVLQSFDDARGPGLVLGL
jgi:hypothetical protein